jgi:hypothetical protein
MILAKPAYGAVVSENLFDTVDRPVLVADQAVATQSRLSISLVVLVVVLFAISGGVLWPLGVNYEGITGSAASKIHPFTYLTILLFGSQVLSSGHIVDFCIRTVKRTPASLLLIAAGLALFCHILVHDGAGMAGAIDTYLGPALLVMLFGWASEDAMRKVEITLHSLMTVNALIALFEFATDARLFPYRFDGELFPTDARSTALQGHPLTDAIVTACYVLALLNGGRSLLSRFGIPMIALQLSALVTFGGRSAIVVTFLLVSIYMLTRGKDLLRGTKLSLPGAAVLVFLISLALILVIPPLSAGGFFDLLIGRFYSDGGSANARLEMFDLLSQISLRELVVGPDLSLIDGLRRVSGLEWGIENPVVKTILYHGLFMTTLLATAVVLFLYEVASRCQRGVWLPVLGFSILLMTAETIGGKTTLLAKFAVIALTMYRPWRARSGSAAWRDQERL